MVAARARLASTLLALCWAASALSGCLLSQEDRVLDFPAQRNRPPRIMEELPIDGNRLTIVEQSSDPCPTLVFGFSAEDPDVDQDLTVRWYVDYPRVPVSAEDREQVLLANHSRAQRDTQGNLTVDLGGVLNLPLNQLQLPVTHIVEAVLFDFRIGPDRKPIPISGADGGILNPSYAVSYAWVVDMRRTTCPP
jgi:hypothetical protein